MLIFLFITHFFFFFFFFFRLRFFSFSRQAGCLLSFADITPRHERCRYYLMLTPLKDAYACHVDAAAAAEMPLERWRHAAFAAACCQRHAATVNLLMPRRHAAMLYLMSLDADADAAMIHFMMITPPCHAMMLMPRFAMPSLFMPTFRRAAAPYYVRRCLMRHIFSFYELAECR